MIRLRASRVFTCLGFLCYSCFRVSEGLVIAARIAWDETDIKAISNTRIPETAKGVVLIVVLYGKDCNHCSISIHPNGQAITIAISTGCINPFDNSIIIPETLEPSNVKKRISKRSTLMDLATYLRAGFLDARTGKLISICTSRPSKNFEPENSPNWYTPRQPPPYTFSKF